MQSNNTPNEQHRLRLNPLAAVSKRPTCQMSRAVDTHEPIAEFVAKRDTQATLTRWV